MARTRFEQKKRAEYLSEETNISSFNSTGPTYTIGARVVLRDNRSGEIIGVDDSSDSYLILTDDGKTTSIGYKDIQQELKDEDPDKLYNADDPAGETKLKTTVESPLIDGYNNNQANTTIDTKN